MKKMLALLTVFALMGAVTGLAETKTEKTVDLGEVVDQTIETASDSALHPLSETGTLVNAVYKPVSEAKDKILEPLQPVTEPVVKVAQKVVNTTWDTVTLKDQRDKAAKK